MTLPEYRRGRKPANAGRRYPIEIPTPEEIGALLDALPHGRAGARDAALIVLLWRCGLRIAEALALELKDIDLGHGVIVILRGKGAKRRVIGVDRVAAGYVERWLAVRERLGVGPEAPLFCSTRNDGGGVGRPVRASAVRQMLKRYARRAAIRKRITPHTLRHTTAHDLAMERVPVSLIQAQLGHANLKMTQLYIGRLAPTALIDALRGREWPAELLPPEPLRPGSVLSQGEGLATPPPSVPQAIEALPPEPPPAPDRGTPAPSGKAQQRVLELLAANGGRATQPQIGRALGITKGRVSQLVAKLYDDGLILSAGYRRDPSCRSARVKVWALTPPKPKLTLDVHDPRERPSPVARRGYGPQRVLDVISGLSGRASQAQIARELGIGSPTVGLHCRSLEREGKLSRAGLDKTSSNRGSQVWRLPPPRLAAVPDGWRKMTFTVPR